MNRFVVSPLLASVVACAQAGISSFDDLDGDRDGRISRQEAGVDLRLAAIFDDVDENGDGQLTAPEYLQAVRRIRG